LLSVADIYLDAFPFSSTTSLIEPLEAGLPVICKQGSTFRSDMGAGILRQLGLPELVADSDASYADLAEHLALDLPERLALKERITAAMGRRPRFLDPVAYGSAMAEVLRTASLESRR
jgi:predicted O-linked N-acetylglucosamine transferase (SPINDLY family)